MNGDDQIEPPPPPRYENPGGERRYLSPQRDKIGRRFWDHVYYWLPIVFGLISMLVGAAAQYGIMEGRLALFAYRLEQQEKANDRQSQQLEDLKREMLTRIEHLSEQIREAKP